MGLASAGVLSIMVDLSLLSVVWSFTSLDLTYVLVVCLYLSGFAASL
jgi:hypothetical protein